MSVPSVNLTLDKGTDFEATFTVTGADGDVFPLDNFSAVSKIRKYPAAPSYNSFSTTITVQTGEIKISMASTVTSQLQSGRNYYDVIIVQNGVNKKTKVFEGMILVNDTVSL